ncbi:MAG: hypothetical protein Q9221_005872 [Calogaya cf. arnoldii]
MKGLDVISVNLMQWSFVLLVCYDPRKTFIRLRQHKKPPSPNRENNKHVQDNLGYIEEPYPSTLSPRIPWVLTLLISLRLSNWKIGHPSHDRRQPIEPLSRGAYCTHALSLAISSLLILDITSLFKQQDPYFHISGTSITSPLPAQLTSSSSNILHFLFNIPPPRLLRTTILALQPYALITQGGSLPTLPIVLLSSLNLWPDEWSPHTWPVFFGPFSSVYERGLRGLWGTWWHQTNRYLSMPGRSLAQLLNLNSQSTVAYIFAVISAFGNSGVMHMGLIPPEPLGTNMTAGEMRLYVGAFFWVQVLGIGIEILVVNAFGRFFLQWNRTIIGRMGTVMWVMLWFSYTLPLLAVPFRELGYWTYPALPVSFVSGVLGRGWWVW